MMYNNPYMNSYSRNMMGWGGYGMGYGMGYGGWGGYGRYGGYIRVPAAVAPATIVVFFPGGPDRGRMRPKRFPKASQTRPELAPNSSQTWSKV